MHNTIPQGRQLRAAAAGDAPARPPKPHLRPLARLDVEQAREFLAGLGDRTAGADLPRAMFLLGRLAEHQQALLDVIDAVVAL